MPYSLHEEAANKHSMGLANASAIAASVLSELQCEMSCTSLSRLFASPHITVIHRDQVMASWIGQVFVSSSGVARQVV